MPVPSGTVGSCPPHAPEGAPAPWRSGQAHRCPSVAIRGRASPPMGGGQRDEWRGNGGEAKFRRPKKSDLGVFRERVMGLEPTSFCLGSRHSAD